MRIFTAFLAALVTALTVTAVAAVETSPRSISPMCEWAFSQAIERLQAGSDAPLAAERPDPGAGPEIRAIGTSLDEAVRLCATVEDFEYGASLHSETLGGIDPLVLLADRCRDTSSGLGKYSTCFYLEQVLATPAPTAEPIAVPSPSTSPRPTPRATNEPQPTKKRTAASRRRMAAVPSNFHAPVPRATRVHYFGVRGNTPKRLLASLRKQASKHCGSHRASACMETRNLGLSTRYRQNPSTGSCVITSVTVSAAYVAHMPRWIGPRRVPAYMAWWWKKSIGRTGWHESQHVKISRQFVAKLPRMVIGKPCHKYNRIVKKWTTALQREQKAFDRLDYPRGHRMDRRWWRAAQERFPS